MYFDQQSYNNLKKSISRLPETLIILGSGWSRVLEEVLNQAEKARKKMKKLITGLLNLGV